MITKRFRNKIIKKSTKICFKTINLFKIIIDSLAFADIYSVSRTKEPFYPSLIFMGHNEVKEYYCNLEYYSTKLTLTSKKYTTWVSFTL